MKYKVLIGGVLGTSITIIDKYVPGKSPFKIIGTINHGSDGEWDLCKPIINSKEKFKRIAIRMKVQDEIQDRD